MSTEGRPVRRQLRRAAEAARTRDEPTVSQRPRRSPYTVRSGAGSPGHQETRRALQFLLRLGELLLRSGAGSADVEASIIASAVALGLQVEASITYTEVQVAVAGVDSEAPVTDLRIVRVRAVDHNRLVAVHQLVLDLTGGHIDGPTAYDRIEAIARAPKRYPRWLITIAWAALATAVAVQLGGGLVLSSIAFATTVFIDRVGRRLARRNVPDFYLNFVGAALVTAVAVVLTAAGAPVQPPLVVAGGVVLLLPGLSLLASVQDALTGFMVTAAGRAFETVVLSAGIAAGVAAALIVARQLGVHMPVQPPSTFSAGDLPMQFVSAGVVAAAMGAGMYGPARLLPPSFLLGGAGYVGFLALDAVVAAPSLARGIIAVGVGLLAQLYALRRRMPSLAVVVPAITPMLPGLTVYAGVLQLTGGGGLNGISTLLQATTEAIALAAGVILGEFLGQPLRRELSRLERRHAGPRMVGPLRVRRPRPGVRPGGNRPADRRPTGPVTGGPPGPPR